ncbi:hypothetical protein HRbin30_02069 [bacterium HR30]|nr:hypothetical protein HRbin30_02069 [bacterium HR30]
MSRGIVRGQIVAVIGSHDGQGKFPSKANEFDVGPFLLWQAVILDLDVVPAIEHGTVLFHDRSRAFDRARSNRLVHFACQATR